MPKRFFRLLSLMVLSMAAASCYVTKQAFVQNNLINSRTPISTLRTSDETPDDIKVKLQDLQKILSFAKHQELNVGRSYRYFVEHDGPITHLVFASRRTEFRWKSWWFPIVGTVPYLGFFSKEDRDLEADRLASEGLDVAKGSAAAFSSLGWYEDPVYSSMLNRSLAMMANLFFHELVHRTLWLDAPTKINEGMAEFLSRQMTVSFLVDQGLDTEARRFQVAVRHKDSFHRWLGLLKAELLRLYQSGVNSSVIIREKRRIIRSHVEAAGALSKKYQRLVKRKEWNNAEIMRYGLYLDVLDSMKDVFDCIGAGKSIGVFLEQLEKSYVDGGENGCTRFL